MWDRRDHGSSEVNHHQPHQKLIFIQRRWCVQCSWKGVLYYELLPENQTTNFHKSCSKIDQLKAGLDENFLELVNRKCIIFQQDKARLYISLLIRQSLLQLGWEILIHQLYSLDIISFGVYLSCLFKISLNGKKIQFSVRLWKETGTVPYSTSLKKKKKKKNKLELWSHLKQCQEMLEQMEKEMATHSSILAWRILWTEEPGGLLSIESHRVGHNWIDLAAAAAAVEQINEYVVQ